MCLHGTERGKFTLSSSTYIYQFWLFSQIGIHITRQWICVQFQEQAMYSPQLFWGILSSQAYAMVHQYVKEVLDLMWLFYEWQWILFAASNSKHTTKTTSSRQICFSYECKVKTTFLIKEYQYNNWTEYYALLRHSNILSKKNNIPYFWNCT